MTNVPFSYIYNLTLLYVSALITLFILLTEIDKPLHLNVKLTMI